jgi:ribulose 1,5-bisphosphate synthetase/thiazole synthase
MAVAMAAAMAAHLPRRAAVNAFRGLCGAASSHTDVAIVGGGHNGLVAALLLARQGLKVRALHH